MAKGIQLNNGREWKSQKDAKDHFREILYRYTDDAEIDDPVDHDDLSALLERYDFAVTNTPSKIGSGITCFVRRLNRGPSYTTPGVLGHADRRHGDRFQLLHGNRRTA